MKKILCLCVLLTGCGSENIAVPDGKQNCINVMFYKLPDNATDSREKRKQIYDYCAAHPMN